jgi:methyltransferase (TIGR00027 family)
MTAPPPIRHVSDTARWVAFYRAMESERPDAVFRDPYARRLAGEQGEAIVNALPRGRQMAWPMIVRTALIDEILVRLVDQEKPDGVVNLAAGLDARPWRLPLPKELLWVDIDTAPMLDLKESTLQDEHPHCRYEAIRQDLSEETGRRTLFEHLGARMQRALVISEGLLIYLEADAVASLARDLAAQGAFRYWLMDLASPGLLRMLEKSWAPALRAGNAPFRFGPAESTRFFEPMGWKEVEYRSMFEESIRLRRAMPMAGLWRFIGLLAPRRKREEFRRFSGVALLERA